MDQFGQAAGALIHRSVSAHWSARAPRPRWHAWVSSSFQTLVLVGLLHAAQEGFCLPLALIYFHRSSLRATQFT